MIRQTLSEVKHGWQAALLILWRQFTEPYRKTVLGFFWAILLPMVPIAAYIMLRLAIQDSSWDDNGVNPGVYVAVGVTLWLWLKDLFLAPITSIQKQSVLITQTRFHAILAILIGVGYRVLELLLRIVLCIPLFIIFTQFSAEQALLSAGFLATSSLICLSAGMLLIPIWVIMPDISQVLDVFFRFFIFFSLAIFPLTLPGKFNLVISANPFAYFIEGFRSALFGDISSISWSHVGVTALIALLLFILGLYTVGAINERLKEALI